MEESTEALLSFTDDGFCETIFRSEASVNEHGRYSAPLPFRSGQFGHSFKGMYQTSLLVSLDSNVEWIAKFSSY